MTAEFGEHGITVNYISPGQIPLDNINADQVETFRNMIPLQRIGLSQDVKGTGRTPRLRRRSMDHRSGVTSRRRLVYLVRHSLVFCSTTSTA